MLKIPVKNFVPLVPPEQEMNDGRSVQMEAVNSQGRVVVKKTGYRKLRTFLVLICFITPSILAFYFFNQYRKLSQDPKEQIRKETLTLVADISKFILLPEGEEPSLATVEEKDKLRKEPFFKNAEDGDKVLIFNIARKAILYRPSIHKIIEVAPLIAEQSPPVSSSQPTLQETSTITPTIEKKKK